MSAKRENRGTKRGRTKSEKAQESVDSDDEEYRKKRDRNNQAVKRSRVKSKLKSQETMDRVTKLKNENLALEEKVKTLTKELGFLKELFLAHGSNSNTDKLKDIDLEKLLADNSTESSSSDKY